MEPGPHVEEMEAAIRADGEGLRALLDGDDERARERLAEAVARYRALVGAGAAAQLRPPRRDAQGGGDRRRRGRGGRVRPRAGRRGRLPAVLLRARDRRARRGRRRGARWPPPSGCAPARPRSAVPPTRSRRWPAATPRHTRAAVRAIVADFECREEHLTGVPSPTPRSCSSGSPSRAASPRTPRARCCPSCGRCGSPRRSSSSR